MAGKTKTVTTQEGPVELATSAPTEAAPAAEVAYSSPLMAKLAREEAERKAKEPKDIFRGPDWSDLPNYFCPFEGCRFATLAGDRAVIAHGVERHPGVDLKEIVTDG